jgi:threonylcarbamoyladenosine tRNA methylthiotransferase MtaB
MFRAAFYTLGCKLNQLETESIAGAFERGGFSLVSGGAVDLLVINTCTVTSHSEQKARRLIRKALAEHPGAAVIVTGCYAQLEPAALSALEAPVSRGRLFVIPGEVKDRLLDLPDFLLREGAEDPAELPGLLGAWMGALSTGEAAGGSAGTGPVSPGDGEGSAPERAGDEDAPDGSFRFRPLNFSRHSRAFLKIQDGCGNHCTYCRVRAARGSSRSLGAEKALATLRELEDRGYGEAVLTVVNLCQ